MTNAHPLVFAFSALLLAAQPLCAQDFSTYRHFRLGGTLASVATAGGITPAEARLVHERPAIIQELRWRPDSVRRQAAQTDPVREIVFSFYNDELFKIAVDYDRQRTQGLTDADLIDAISSTYGSPVLTARDLRSPAVPSDSNADRVVARWADADASLVLLRGSYSTGVRLEMSSKRLGSLARTATAEAVRADEREAPQRKLDEEKKRVDDRQVATDEARKVNKPGFTP